MAQARRHHYISQFYLRNFVSDPVSPRLFVVDFPGQKNFITSPSNVALENDFHTITTPGQEPDAVEKRLSQFEGEVAPALDRIIQSASLANANDSGLVLFFATLLLIKGPANRKLFNSLVNTIMREVGKREASDQQAFDTKIKRYIAEGVMPPDTNIEEMRQLILADAFDIGLSTEAHLDMEFDNARSLFKEFVATRHWNVHVAKEGQFVTCDRPVVLMWADPKKTDPVGLALRNTRVLFPLSSRVAICGGFELKDATVEASAEDVAKINGRIILNANRQVFAQDDNFQYLLPHNNGIRQGSALSSDYLAKEKAGMA